MIKDKGKLNLIIIGVAFCLIAFAVTFVFKAENQDINAAQQYNLDKLEQKAKAFYYQGSYQKSMKLYQEVIDKSNTRVDTHKDLAVVYEAIGDYKAAVNEYKTVLSMTSEEHLVYYDLGELYYNLGDYNKALENIKKAVKHIEDKSILKLAYLKLAKIYKQQADYHSALSAVKQVLEFDPNSAMAYYYSGQINDKLDQTKKAVADYKQALEKDGSFVEAQLYLANDYFKLGRYKEAKKLYKKILERSDKFKLAQMKLDKIKDIKPDLFKTPEQEQISEEEKRKKLLNKEVTFAQIDPVETEEDLPELRIGLAEDREYLAFRVDADFVIKDKASKKVLFKGEADKPWQFKITDAGELSLFDKSGKLRKKLTKPVIIEAKQDNVPILLHNINYGQGYYWAGKEDRQYRGEIELKITGDTFTIINLVNLEAYLYSVVPSEMSASWPIAALKAQTVAARSYTLFHLGRHGYEGYDLCSTVHCAAYSGITKEHHRAIQAVNETVGEVLTYKGRPINAVYSANSGGRTESSAAVWGGAVPYLQGASTTLAVTEGKDFRENFPLDPYQLQNWISTVPKSYSGHLEYGRANRYRWQRVIRADEIAAKLDIGKIKKIVPTARAKGGTIKALKLIGTKGEKVIDRGLRSFFGGLRSNRFVVRSEYDHGEFPVNFIFYGGGWGHNVGMDQIAAANMAHSDYSYDEILFHFYTGVELTDKY
ncbi:SpoIID/LytB domain-containing protein [Sporohalobacter salinus]|uniref:SpoIID/LytB domain-containing protein n=1 Tax=Sporohalobacter salinus TaxID=1494606 RepID=UPI001961E627|nr:SpoIID/LytB domain-containing protein [Sporohalobacter salinus]MBM7623004.1 SpoIID/LytB domain protein [Sporohalobacter salinus]